MSAKQGMKQNPGYGCSPNGQGDAHRMNYLVGNGRGGVGSGQGYVWVTVRCLFWFRDVTKMATGELP